MGSKRAPVATAKPTAAHLAAAQVLQLERELTERIRALAKSGPELEESDAEPAKSEAASDATKFTREIARQLTALLQDPVGLDRAVSLLSAALRALDGSDPDARAQVAWRTWIATVELVRDHRMDPDDAATVAVTMVAGTGGFGDIDRALFKKGYALDHLARSADAYVKGPRVGQSSVWRGLFDDFAHAAGASEDAIKRMKPRKMPT